MASDLKVLCLLDVLGFEALFKSIGLEALAARYEKLICYVKEQTGGLNIIPTPDGHVAVGWLVISNTYFSDTLLFWTRYNQMSLPSFTYLIAEAICYGLENELPLRGTLTVGEMVLDKDTGTYLGKPLIEAARTERLQQWIGVSLGVSFSQPGFNKGFYLDTVLPYKSHYKDQASPLVTGMVVDWPRKWRVSRGTDIREVVSKMDIEPQFSKYYTNTLKFIDFSEQNHDWFKSQSHLDYG
jgi:hypothetical protein